MSRPANMVESLGGSNVNVSSESLSKNCHECDFWTLDDYFYTISCSIAKMRVMLKQIKEDKKSSVDFGTIAADVVKMMDVVKFETSLDKLVGEDGEKCDIAYGAFDQRVVCLHNLLSGLMYIYYVELFANRELKIEKVCCPDSGLVTRIPTIRVSKDDVYKKQLDAFKTSLYAGPFPSEFNGEAAGLKNGLKCLEDEMKAIKTVRDELNFRVKMEQFDVAITAFMQTVSESDAEKNRIAKLKDRLLEKPTEDEFLKMLNDDDCWQHPGRKSQLKRDRPEGTE